MKLLDACNAVWRGWTAATEKKQRTRRLLTCLVNRRCQALLITALTGWVTVLRDRQGFRERLQSMATKADTGLLAKSFNGWIDVQQAQQVRKSLVARSCLSINGACL